MGINIIPIQTVIPAYKLETAICEIVFTRDVTKIRVEVSDYLREFFGEELSIGTIKINLQKYIEGFEVSDKEIYSPVFSIIESELLKKYTVTVTGFTESDSYQAMININVLCAIDFKNIDPLMESDQLVDVNMVNIVDIQGENIMVIKLK